jgi:hypothetical protein
LVLAVPEEEAVSVSSLTIFHAVSGAMFEFVLAGGVEDMFEANEEDGERV